MSTTSELAPRRAAGNESALASTGALAISARNGELGARSFFNRALWGKALFECRGLLLASLALMFSFHWIFVWITSMVQLGPLADFVKTLPNGIQNLSGVPVNELATVAGRIALAYVDPVVLFTAAVWGISRGSDAVAGEIDRGTMEMLLAQPIDRLALLLTKGAVAVLGAALIAVVSFAGTWCGLTAVTLEEPTSIWAFLPAAINLFAMTFFLVGVSFAVSSFDRYRWRVIGLLGGFYTLSLIVNVMARMVEKLGWLEYFTFFGAYEPQGMTAFMLEEPAKAWAMSLHFDGLLIGLGLVGFAVSAVVFARRDIPAPL